MGKIKVNRIKGYTVMSNYHLMDKRLTLKSKGLLSLMLALPDNWDYSIKGLVAISVENETAIRSALKELEELKYLIRIRFKNELGKFDYNYEVYEKPYADSPHIENPYAENLHTGDPHTDDPHTENQVQINTNKEITNKIITKEENKKELNKEIVINNNKEKNLSEAEEVKKLIDNEFGHNKELLNSINELLKLRLASKKTKNSLFAIKLLINELNKLTNDDDEKIAIINQSILRGWISVFPLKKNNYNNYNQQQEFDFSSKSDPNDFRKVSKEEQEALQRECDEIGL